MSLAPTFIQPDLEVRFWGVRGSIPCPGPDTIVYGGNTACVEVRCGKRLVVLDAGSGLHPLGRQLAALPGPVDLDILISHCHIDHLIGLPFFVPAFVKTTSLRLWAGHSSPGDHLQRMLEQLMEPPLLPITPKTFQATIIYRDVPDTDRLDLGDGITVLTAPLNHPGGATGYRIDYRDCAVAYVSDHEHTPGEPDAALVRLTEGCDLLIYDATYLPQTYSHCHGWGHSTWEEGIRLAERVGAKQLALFHHDPNHDDATLDRVGLEASLRRPGTFVAREGQRLGFRSASTP